MSASARFERLPTAAKLFLILSLVMLPIGLVLTWLGANGIESAKQAQQARASDQARLTARAIESLLARNALALRIAATGAMSNGPEAVCERARRSLSIAPAVAQRFQIHSPEGILICSVGDAADTTHLPLVAPGDVNVQIDQAIRGLLIRMGVAGGMATAIIPLDEIRAASRESGNSFATLTLRDALKRSLPVIERADDAHLQHSEWPVGRDQLTVRIGMVPAQVTISERLMLLLPVLMWVAAALISWLLVTRLLVRPLRLLEKAVSNFQPGETELDLPDRLGPSAEIQQLRDSFANALERIDSSEREMTTALEGQRRLVREVHHRVKNNLQVVASLLNIHGRSAASPEARDAYVAIGRRVGALSVVHRNHFAEMEESRGIALRPLLSELAAELRASAPEDARSFTIELDVDAVSTTQDVAVAIAFLVTEIVEYAMLSAPDDVVEITLRRTSELTARLTLNSSILNPDKDDPEKRQFERIVAGLAKQLRSALDRKLGRYSVEFPVFPQKS